MSKIFFMPLGVAFLLLALVTATRGFPPTATEPEKSQWSVTQVSDTLFPGTTDSITVSFRTREKLKNVAVSLTPSLSSVISVTPNLLEDVVPNTDYRIQIQFRAPPAFLKRTFRGVIQLREHDQSGESFSLPLPISLNTAWNTSLFQSNSLRFSLNLPLQWTSSEQMGVIGIYPPGKTNDPDSEYAGDFLIFIDQNSSGASFENYYNGILGPSLYSDSSSSIPIQVNGQSAIRFSMDTGIDATEVTVIATPSAFIRFESRGDSSLGEQVVQSISLQ